MLFRSKTTKGFYDREIHGTNMPEDVVELSTATHESLLDGQAQGKMIMSDAQGYPVLAEPVAPPHEDIIYRTQAARAAAYAAESDPLFFQYQRGEVDRQAWLDKVQEIKDRFPKP